MELEDEKKKNLWLEEKAQGEVKETGQQDFFLLFIQTSSLQKFFTSFGFCLQIKEKFQLQFQF
jgi:hypothetical protein